MFVRPALVPEGQEGAGTRYKIRDPFTFRHLAEDGEHKPDSEYWLRRLNEGGIEIIEPARSDEPEEPPIDVEPAPLSEPEPDHAPEAAQ